jgi:hypothetical protein
MTASTTGLGIGFGAIGGLLDVAGHAEGNAQRRETMALALAFAASLPAGHRQPGAPARLGAAEWTERSAPTPPAPDIAQIVKRTAEVMPHPLPLTDRFTVTSFTASASTLALSMAGPAITDAAGRAALGSAICHHRALLPVLGQGGTITAGDLTLTRKDCVS